MNESSLLLLLLSSSLFDLSPICRVFTIIYLKQIMFLGCVVLQLFIFTICTTYSVTLCVKCVLYFYSSTFCSMCAVPNIAVFL
jgi:hypothetical protein